MEQNPKSMATDGETPSKGGGSAASAKRASGRAKRVSSRSASKAAQSSGGKPRGTSSKSSGSSGASSASSKPVNGVRAARIERMMSKAELARRAGLSVLTIDRVEKGLDCRMDTKRKVLEALGLRPEDRVRVFGEEE
jgi:DNA-binding XRE family transcriptional regulator